MNEAFLQHIWKYQLFEKESLKLDDGELIDVIHPGDHNNNAGPDFINAKIRMENKLWAGNVEVHINSSDWKKHGHHTNKAYDNVILQIVDNNDTPVKRTNGQVIPTIKLEYNKQFYDNYDKLVQSMFWLPCYKELPDIDPFHINYWLEKLMVERLEQKTQSILQVYHANKNSWEDTFYRQIAGNFGMKVNAQPFEMLTQSLPLKYLAKQKNCLLQIEALLFGQAGMLNQPNIDDPYYIKLVNEYSFLKNKYQLKALEPHIWKFGRLRPSNFPTIRLAQFAALIYKSTGLFSRIIETDSIKEIKEMLKVTASNYWADHYNFGKESVKKEKKLGNAAIDVILINTVVPFLFVYGKTKDLQKYTDRAMHFIEQVSPEHNHITKRWSDLGVKPQNALQSQALLQLTNYYCKNKRCLDCLIGSKIITRI
jgi:hypothetical protein